MEVKYCEQLKFGDTRDFPEVGPGWRSGYDRHGKFRKWVWLVFPFVILWALWTDKGNNKFAAGC